MRLRSLRLRVLISATLWIALSLGIGGYAILTVFEKATLRQFDQRLQEGLAVLRVAVATEPQDPTLRMTSPSFSRVYSGLYFQAETEGFTVASRSLWDRHLPLGAPGAIPEQQLVSGPDGQQLRLLSQSVRVNDGPRWRLGVAADLASMETLVASFRRSLSFGLCAFGVSLIVAAALMLNAALGPLKRLHEAVVRLSHTDARPAPDVFPIEVAPLVRDLDRLIERNRRQRDRGRLQAAGLAHALKTPTTVLSGEIQRAAQGRPLDLNAAEDALARLKEATALHLDHAATGPEAMLPGERVDVMATLDDLVRAVGRLYPHIRFDVKGPHQMGLAVTLPDLQEMLGNLIENAAYWAQGHVHVTLEAEGEAVILIVEDDGPGVPLLDRARVFDRGVRLDPDRGGSGLGMTIARDVANLYGGSIRLDTAGLGGLRVILRLPFDAGEHGPATNCAGP
ncbi:HAMP domain-containing sensor histidine kinase [uncultured Roseobacter sp.]|uniref:sensor histidine kinase n=1 Tax=uncultured Roseobacter sp. TaxID=114847 RepID=UPI0026146A5C|nr:HAMP domain-containing sensor histidine kinase [uncultured Roseobacter sp.]